MQLYKYIIMNGKIFFSKLIRRLDISLAKRVYVGIESSLLIQSVSTILREIFLVQIFSLSYFISSCNSLKSLPELILLMSCFTMRAKKMRSKLGKKVGNHKIK